MLFDLNFRRQMSDSNLNKLRQIQCLVRGDEVVSTSKKATRIAIEAFIIGLGPPLSFCSSQFTNDLIFMNKLVPRGLTEKLTEPSNFGLQDTENFELMSKSGNKIFGWKQNAQGNVLGSVLYLHGSGGNRGWPNYRTNLMAILSLCGFNVLNIGKILTFFQ